MNYTAINLASRFEKFTDTWSPRIVAEMNDYQIKLVRLEGEFVWHSHEHTDETFIVLEGSLTIEFRDGCVQLQTGEMFVVPKDVEHRPVAETMCKIMIIEPRGVTNTGTADGSLTAPNDIWI
ncbi:MAG: cupin domain-containing protein [Pirellulaceae bacterium]|jgi:mannose-6-phosphate isomerase-like protein (cupin superfamily)|nr:cupin domain-containing protein [Pirellulaceae bacterium]